MDGLAKAKGSVVKAATQPKNRIYTGEDRPLSDNDVLRNTKALGAVQEADKYQKLPKRPEITLKD